VRGSFAEVLSAVSADPQDLQSICRQLGLNKNLAWKISKIVQADDPSVALEQMPGSPGLRIFLECAERAGVTSEVVAGAQRAIEGYERLIEVHSGDRATLEMMGSELSPNGRHERDEQRRKLLFQGASYVWGAQTRVNLKVGLVGPGAQPGLLDFASVNALIDFRRIREDVTWVLASRRSCNDDGTEMETSASEPVDPSFTRSDLAPLMAEFCSKPLPEFRRLTSGGVTAFELVEGPVGNTGALTCVFGAIQRGVPFYRSPTNEWGEHSAACDVPSELLIMDLFFHRTFEFARRHEAILYSELGAPIGHTGREQERKRLPLHDPVIDLGAGPLPVGTPEIPRYNPMVQAAFRRVGWDPAEFYGFRIKVAFPAMPTALVVRYRLPDAPA
jgi:hypothetical protein